MSDQPFSPHIDVHPSVVFHLGERLISDDVQAIVELIKNSYDADANWARLVIDTNKVTSKPSSFFDGCRGQIVVEDDGTGMDRDDIVRGWLTIADSPKVRQSEKRVTPINKRTPLGEKGLGRLGVQRLGSVVELYTSKINVERVPDPNGGDPIILEHPEGLSYHVGIDWRDFAGHDRLSQVPVQFDAKPLAPSGRGTRIIVSGLRDQSIWTKSTVQDLQSKLSQFISPIERVRSFEIYAVVNSETLDLVSVSEQVIDSAQSQFRFSYSNDTLSVEGRYKIGALAPGERRQQHEIDAFQRLMVPDRGLAFFDFLMASTSVAQSTNAKYHPGKPWVISVRAERKTEDLGETSLRGKESRPGLKIEAFGETNLFGERFADPGPFTGEIHVFRLDRETIPSLGGGVFNDVTAMVKRHRGVRVFRDGFAIRPYGIEGDDWLKLGAAQTEGSSYYGIRPGNVIGYVSISARDNGQLVEKTDREGFTDNLASRNLFRLMREVVDMINRWNEVLRRGYTSFVKAKDIELAGVGSTVSPDVVFERVRSIGSEAAKLDETVLVLEHSVAQTLKASVSIGSAAAKLEDKQLASLSKELRGLVDMSQQQLQTIRSHVQRITGLDAAARLLEADTKKIRDQMQQFAELASLGLSAEAVSHELWTVASSIVERTDQLFDYLQRGRISDSEILRYVEYNRSAISAIRKQLSHLDPGLRYVRERSDRFGVLDFAVDIKQFYQDRFARSSISIIVDTPFPDFRVKINRGKLTQVVDNLVLNSEYWLQHDLKLGRIEQAVVHLRSVPPVLRVWDTGCGVDPSLDEGVFEPFVTNKPKGIGRGLGLFIARQLLESSGCFIDLSPDKNQFGRRHAFDLNLDGVIQGNA